MILGILSFLGIYIKYSAVLRVKESIILIYSNDKMKNRGKE